MDFFENSIGTCRKEKLNKNLFKDFKTNNVIELIETKQQKSCGHVKRKSTEKLYKQVFTCLNSTENKGRDDQLRKTWHRGILYIMEGKKTCRMVYGILN